ncbi:acyl-CoA dehydrogenase [Lentibacter algarum]|uniref:acyl-CoA dehydrogenase family protein n=1 Tax=Lentibacter algarum TaxID=576131 RepID=UPI001C0A5F2D|nr:acyl-CoA dehydrogenase [Lentibacter algarum]MBU2983363.1 acyl-CoA dehydrogenase [Lentibacter algarum]
MNFDLTEERQMLQDTLRRFLAGAEGDLWPQLAELGVIGALFSEAQGGFGGAGFDLSVVFEELGRADVEVPLIDNALLPGLLLAAAGESVEALIDGSERLAFAHNEQAARYDYNWVETRFENGKLTGEKSVIVGADSADSFIISARHAGTPEAEQGIGLYRVDKAATGLTLRAYDLIQGGRGADITLENTPATLLMEDAYGAITAAMAAATLAVSAETLGSMQTAVEMTAEYLGTRKQFGRPIGTFQALRHRLVDMMVELEQARSAVILGAGNLDAAPNERDFVLSATKNIIGRVGRLVTEESIQMHGGIGMTQEYALGRFAKRITMADHRFGDTDHHLEQFIALGVGV